MRRAKSAVTARCAAAVTAAAVTAAGAACEAEVQLGNLGQDTSALGIYLSDTLGGIIVHAGGCVLEGLRRYVASVCLQLGRTSAHLDLLSWAGARWKLLQLLPATFHKSGWPTTSSLLIHHLSFGCSGTAPMGSQPRACTGTGGPATI